MKLTIQIDDEIYDKLLKAHKSKAAVERLAVQGLDVMRKITPGDRFFVVAGEDRQGIEKIVQTTVANSSQLLKHISNMSKVRIGNVDRSFTADELIRLDTQAKFHGWTSEKYLELTSDEAIRYVMDRI